MKFHFIISFEWEQSKLFIAFTGIRFNFLITLKWKYFASNLTSIWFKLFEEKTKIFLKKKFILFQFFLVWPKVFAHFFFVVREKNLPFELYSEKERKSKLCNASCVYKIEFIERKREKKYEKIRENRNFFCVKKNERIE